MGCEKILLLAGWIFRIVRFTSIKPTILKIHVYSSSSSSMWFLPAQEAFKRLRGGLRRGPDRAWTVPRRGKKNENGPRRSQEARRCENLGFQNRPMGFQQIFFHSQCEKISVERFWANFIVLFASPRLSELWVLPA